MNIFSAISGHFGRAIVIGALLPSTLFIGAAYLFLLPMIPWEWRVVARIEAIQPEWKLAAIAILSILGAGLLHVFNIAIIRLYEGYPWRHSPIGARRAAMYNERIAKAEKDGLAARQVATRLADAHSDLARRLDDLRDEVQRDAMSGYPRAGNALPTRLGNTILSFEEYPDRQYEIAAITLWSHFAAKIRTEHAAAMDEAKTSFDVMIHLSFLSGLMLLLFAGVACMFPAPFASPRLLLPFAGRLVVCAALAWFFYTSSIGRAAEWGQLVRSVFDLYRWEVLQSFGFEQRPRDLETERAIWYELSQQVVYGDPHVGRLAVRYEPGTIVLPAGYGFSATRGIVSVDASTRTVVIRVDNPRDQDFDDVAVIETLPAGSEYIWDSSNVEVTGANPYRFTVRQLPAGGTALVTYRLLLRKT